MKNQITIASVQMYVHEAMNKNIKTMEKYLAHIKNTFPHIEMVVFPELAAHGQNKDILVEAESVPGRLTDVFTNLSQKYSLWLIPGSIYEKSGESIFNTTPIFSPKEGLIGKYRKRFPWCPYEKTTPGNAPLVFSIESIGTIGIMICYDMWFPEVARDLTNQGAELIIVPTMTTTGDRPHEKILARATAITQQCYIISCNGVGFGGVGGSIIVDPEGSILQESGEGPYMQTAIVDFEKVRTIREKGIAGVTKPLKDFNQNKQIFSVYNNGKFKK